MAVNNNKTDIQPTDLGISESFLKKLSYNQKLIISALTEKSEGILSRALTHKTGISNKASVLSSKLLKELLKKQGLEIHTQRVDRQWLWSLRPIKDIELTEQRE